MRWESGCWARHSAGSWPIAWRAGGTGIDVTSALRPETHKLLTSDQLAIVQAQLGRTLRDVYLQMAALGIGTMLCALWLPNKHATLDASEAKDRDDQEDETMAVAVSEL